MTVKELRDFLADKDGDLEVYTSRWTHRGEVRQRMRLSRKEPHISDCGKHLMVSWTDDCIADTIYDQEFKTGKPR